METIIYETQWVARDRNKEYPHGWGFIAPLVEFPKDADPAWCGKMCRIHLGDEEFECIGAIPKHTIRGLFYLDYPKAE